MTGMGIKRMRANKDGTKIWVKLCLVSFLIRMDAKKNLKPCQILFLCVLCVFAVKIYFISNKKTRSHKLRVYQVKCKKAVRP